MDNKKHNKWDSCGAIKALFENTNIAEISGLPEAFAEFVKELDIADTLMKRQSMRVEVAITHRDAAVEAATHAALALAGEVFSYATRKQLHELAANVRVTVSDFSRVRLSRRVRLAQHVHDAVVAALPILGDANIAAKAAALLAKITAANEALAKPRSAVVQRAEATAQLHVVFRRITAILSRQIDPLMLPQRTENPELYRKYKLARMVINRRGGRAGDEEKPEAPASAKMADEKLAA